jgi:sec-independent protein translocase protein TatB
MFNFSGSEIIFLLILGLVVLGPEKLPVVLRKAGRLYGEFKRVTSDAQSDFRQAFAEPIKDFQDAANEYKSVFTSAADEVGGSLAQTVAPDEPIFIPFEVTDEGISDVTESEEPAVPADEDAANVAQADGPAPQTAVEEDH